MDTEAYLAKLALLLNLDSRDKEKVKKIIQQQAESPATAQQQS